MLHLTQCQVRRFLLLVVLSFSHLVVVAGHQQMAMNEKCRVLHRDVSRNNILLNPDHQDAVIDYERKAGLVPFVPIKNIIAGTAGCVSSM